VTTQETERFTRIAWKRKKELVQEMVFYKNVSGKFWIIIIQRYLYPNIQTNTLFSNTGEARRYWCSLLPTPSVAGLAGTLPSLAGWLGDNWRTTARLVWRPCCAATLPCGSGFFWCPSAASSPIPSGPAWLRLWSSSLPMASPPTGPAMIF